MKRLNRFLFGADNKIGRRLMVLIIAFSSAITLVISVVQLALDYHQLRGGLDEQLDVVSIHIPGIADSVWNFDDRQIMLSLTALKQLPNIDQTRIMSESTQWELGKVMSARTVTRTYSLRKSDIGKDIEIGKLEVVASLDSIYRQVAADALTIVLGNGLKTFCVALFMVVLFRRLVTSRLEVLARRVRDLGQQIHPARPARAFNIAEASAPTEHGDELDAVAKVLDNTARELKRAADERETAAAEIEHLAFYDDLTGLPNRRLLLDRLQQAVSTSFRSRRYGAVLLLDLDDFKTLNDTRGHDKGDLLLKQVAQRLVSCIRKDDSVGRLGGDEFVVVLEGLGENPEEAAAHTKDVAEKILGTLNKPYLLDDYAHHSTPSIGITLFGDQHRTVDDLLKRADVAMYQAKAAGRNTRCFFDPEMQSVLAARAKLETELRAGMQKNEFLLYYQPQVDSEGRLTGAEALVRWQQPERGMVSPGLFIPLAEETGLILPLGHWVLETACRQLAEWVNQPDMAHLKLAVNVSANQFRQPTFVREVLSVLQQTGADPRLLKLELTESLLLDNVEDIINKMTELKAHGVGFSLDDFGTGYSSLSYLKRLPLDQLKIDQSFVRDVLTDPNDAAIAKTIVALAQSLGLEVIAEGVETAEQRDFLASSGCPAYQGYFFGRPGPAEALRARNWPQPPSMS